MTLPQVHNRVGKGAWNFRFKFFYQITPPPDFFIIMVLCAPSPTLDSNLYARAGGLCNKYEDVEEFSRPKGSVIDKRYYL